MKDYGQEQGNTLQIPTVFERSIFDPRRVNWLSMSTPSRFIRPIHPKTMIAPEESAIRKVTAKDWWGQPKVHGHRAQIHIPADNSPCIVFNRQGKPHKEKLSKELEKELRRIFAPSVDWNTIDAEWMKPEGKIYVFDFLKREGELLNKLSFSERYDLLPKLYLSPYISTLPVFKTAEKCMGYLTSELPAFIEGLVFRSALTKGFSDNTIVRCRL